MIHNFSESTKSSSEKLVDTTVGKLQYSVPGVFTQQDSTRISILNGSLQTISEHHDRETVLIFPEYRVAFGIENTQKAAELFYEKAVSPSTTYIPTIPEESEAGELPFGILPIPYSCVILLCELFSDPFASIIYPSPTVKAPTSDETSAVTLLLLSSKKVHSLLRNQPQYIPEDDGFT